MLEYLQLKGSYYEIGKAFGKSRRADRLLYHTPDNERLEYAYACEDVVRTHAPDLLDELRGFSDGIGLEYQQILPTHILPVVSTGCNLFFVKGESTCTRLPIFVRHMDWIEDDLKFLNLLETKPVGKHSVLGFNLADLGCFDGLNETGLAVGTASIPFYIGKNGVGIRENLATRWSLDNFSTVEETAEYLKSIPHVQPIVYLIADKTGVSARVECTPIRVDAEISESNLRIVCNFFMLGSMKELDSMPKDDRAWTYYRRIMEWFTQSNNDVKLDDIKRICRSHNTGICEHLDNPPGGTIYSWFSELGTGIIHLAVGYPCKNDYQRYQFTR
ncbi:MAG: C45 family autoproteolytic acyltransferase/hydrolase [Candidatus Thorarchaeota archaeon]